jgi:riboflavin synthase
MFTGIIETLGGIEEVTEKGSNKTFWIKSSIAVHLKVDQSIAHDGVCLTVEEIINDGYRVTAIEETLQKTNLNNRAAGSFVNLERSLVPTTRLDGHFVQGHVDTTGSCKKIKNTNGSWELTISFQKKFASLIIEKGSICLNGISLTCFDVKKDSFKVAIIPFTWQHTNLKFLKEKDKVNLEFDLIGKYILRNVILNNLA